MTWGHRDGALSEDQTYYLVVIDSIRLVLAKHYTTRFWNLKKCRQTSYNNNLIDYLKDLWLYVVFLFFLMFPPVLSDQLSGAVEYTDCISPMNQWMSLYDTKPSISEASVLKLWGIRSALSWSLLAGLLCPGW